MHCKKGTALSLIALLALLEAPAEVLTWKANAGQQYETRITLRESVTGLESITAKPVQITDAAPYQEEAATGQTTVPRLKRLITFPKGSVETGSSWEGETEITYDLSAFGIKDPLILPAKVVYTLEEPMEVEGQKYFRIKAKWVPFYILPEKDAKRSNIARLSGVSTMDLLWDNRSGAPKRSRISEELQYRFTDGTALLSTVITEESFNTVTEIVRASIVSQLQEQIKEQKVENVEVKQTEQGIVLSIENIGFKPDSAELVDAEKQKLVNIGTVLSTLKGRKLSIVGHAANAAGSDEAELLQLSADRAQAVADFIVGSGIKAADEVVASGAGGAVPIDTNDTPEGRSRNRRVEIIILDEETGQ